MSKIPIKYKYTPLTVRAQVEVTTPYILDIESKDDAKCLMKDIADTYFKKKDHEVHSVVFEAVVGNYSNSVKDILSMRRQLKHTLKMLETGGDISTFEWKITDFDFALNR